MKKAMSNKRRRKNISTQILGGLMIGFAAIDFIASFAGV